VRIEETAICQVIADGKICELSERLMGELDGMARAVTPPMAVLQDLIVWQLAAELRDQVAALTELPSARRDFPLVNQIRGAAGSVAANVAEGYGRQRHIEFARFLDFAMGSLRETDEWLRDGTRRQLWTEDQAAPAHRTCRRLTPALQSLRRYLRTVKQPQ
jgi:four helix bundle protein